MKQLIGFVIAFGIMAISLPHLMQRQAVPENAQAQSQEQTNAPAPKPQKKTIAVSTTSSGEVRLKPDQLGHYTADFKMNGRTVSALVDTGASTVAINKSTARKLGLNLNANDFVYDVNTANGVTKAAVAMIREIQIGRILVRNVEAAVLDDRALDGTLLGMSFLKRLKGFSVANGDLILKQ